MDDPQEITDELYIETVLMVHEGEQLDWGTATPTLKGDSLYDRFLRYAFENDEPVISIYETPAIDIAWDESNLEFASEFEALMGAERIEQLQEGEPPTPEELQIYRKSLTTHSENMVETNTYMYSIKFTDQPNTDPLSFFLTCTKMSSHGGLESEVFDSSGPFIKYEDIKGFLTSITSTQFSFDISPHEQLAPLAIWLAERQEQAANRIPVYDSSQPGNSFLMDPSTGEIFESASPQ